jgi:hypothetical protein
LQRHVQSDEAGWCHWHVFHGIVQFIQFVKGTLVMVFIKCKKGCGTENDTIFLHEHVEGNALDSRAMVVNLIENFAKRGLLGTTDIASIIGVKPNDVIIDND